MVKPARIRGLKSVRVLYDEMFQRRIEHKKKGSMRASRVIRGAELH